MQPKFPRLLLIEMEGKNNTSLPAHCLDAGFLHQFDFHNADDVLCRVETHWGSSSKRLNKKEAMYFIAMMVVKNTCNIKKGRDLNPIWPPLLRHFT
mmetsp:Transcript_56086/g.82037  ORF Transcript_56086/g.82037 Transcript_56086/m.82037 type:complete len:96 (-) Transcript_56086:237-524(-)